MDTLVSGWGRRYASNPRTLGISPRQLGTNPRALSRNPSVGTSADKHRVAAHRARAERVLSMYGIALCEPCEGTGWVETAAGMVRCQHQPAAVSTHPVPSHGSQRAIPYIDSTRSALAL